MGIQENFERTLAEQRVLLQNISWETFERLLAELGEHRAAHLSYDEETLEIMSPLLPHENSNRMLEMLIFILFEELGLEFRLAGSLTCKRKDLGKGTEPDSCYYIRHETRIRHKERLDLNVDPPPDLAVEIEYTSSALAKLELYAALGVPEVWRYNGQMLRFYELRGNQYQECPHSPTFAPLPTAELAGFLEMGRQDGELSMSRRFRAWVRAQRI